MTANLRHSVVPLITTIQKLFSADLARENSAFERTALSSYSGAGANVERYRRGERPFEGTPVALASFRTASN